MTSPTGFAFSQVGYDVGSAKRAIIRGPERTLSELASFDVIEEASGSIVFTKTVHSWGVKWGSHWWVCDFSNVDLQGKYRLVVRDDESVKFSSSGFEIGDLLLWNRTSYFVGVDQGRRRSQLARNKIGWYDAGAEWQEADSHVAYLVGFIDILEFAADRLTPTQRREVEEQICNGSDYLASLQDRASTLADGEGAIVHQIWMYENLILPSDVSKAALAWMRAARFLSDTHSDRKVAYLARAKRALKWLESAEPLGDRGFSRANHGVPPEVEIPKEWMTRDLLMELWARYEWAAHFGGDLAACTVLARCIIGRQVPQDSPEGTFYGHFRTFDSTSFTEKAWIHNGEGGVLGADMGGHFPNYLLPLIAMYRTWPTHPDAELWKSAIKNFAYGYLLPAAKSNPFGLLPLGFFQGQGLIWFAGLWHGMNAAYALTAALAIELASFLDDSVFRDLAVGNLQWIAGLNAGVTAESLFASHMFSRDIPAGIALPCSMIQGFGKEQAGNWMQIRGAICNGFSTGDQFRFDVEATVENDGPYSFTDEDWISHAGGWLSAIARL